MKPKNRILKTALLLIGGSLLVIIFKVIQFENLPYEVKQLYEDFWDYGGRGGIFGNITIVVIFGLILNLWKKSTEEKLIKYGYKNEVEKLRNLYSEKVISKYEFEEKLKTLLDTYNQNKFQADNTKSDLEINAKKEKLLKELEELKSKGLINEIEYNIKKAEINSSEVELPNQTVIDKIISNVDFDSNTEKYLTEEFNPLIENRSNKELLEIIANWNKYNKSALFQAIIEVEKRNTTANKGYK